VRIDVPARVARGGTPAAVGPPAAGRFARRRPRTQSRRLWGAAAVLCASSAAKLALVRQLGLGGMFLWMYGEAAPGTWPQLRRSLASGAGPAAGPSGRP
jgi:hypothetical protein